MVGLLGTGYHPGRARQVDVDVGVGLAIFFTFIDAGHLIPILAVLIIVVVTTVVRVRLLVQIVKN